MGGKHTPGPWAQGRLLMTHDVLRWTRAHQEEADALERRMVFARFTAGDFGRSRRRIAIAETEEDARLIAAAPELLEALQAMTHGLPELLEAIGYSDEEDMIGKALAAIAKATAPDDGASSASTPGNSGRNP